jgi:hypothetical protein
MTYTTHGHHISGTVLNESERPSAVARCGGPGLCAQCSQEAATAQNKLRKEGIEETSENFKMGVETDNSGEDSVSNPNVEPPTEPGFYHYDGGNQKMVFILMPDGEWFVQWDNAEGPLACDWRYIEQALGVYNLRKLKPHAPDDWRVLTNLPVFLPGNNRNFEQAQGRAGIDHDGRIIITLQKEEMADELVEMAKRNILFQIAVDYRLPLDQLEKINNQFAMYVPADMDKVREVFRQNGYLDSDIPDLLQTFEKANIKFVEEK